MTATATTAPAFHWPSRGRRASTPAFRRELAQRVKALMQARGIGVNEVAVAFGDEEGVRYKNRLRVKELLAARVGLREPSARQLAQFFGHTNEQHARAPPTPGGNGHDLAPDALKASAKHRPPPPPAPRVPTSAPPLGIELKTYKGDPSFMVVTITGTVHVDKAMSLLALLHT
jgi:hypothetical protein